MCPKLNFLKFNYSIDRIINCHLPNFETPNEKVIEMKILITLMHSTRETWSELKG